MHFDLFPHDFGTEIGEKICKKHNYGPFETIIGYRVPIHSLPKLQEQRGGLRVSALGSAALLPLAGAAKGVLDRGYIESFRKRKLSIGGYTTAHFENQRFPVVKLPILA